MFKKFEYKILYKRIFFTCLILVIYIIGSNISIVSNENLRTHKDSFPTISQVLIIKISIT